MSSFSLTIVLTLHSNNSESSFKTNTHNGLTIPCSSLIFSFVGSLLSLIILTFLLENIFVTFVASLFVNFFNFVPMCKAPGIKFVYFLFSRYSFKLNQSKSFIFSTNLLLIFPTTSYLPMSILLRIFSR